MTTRRGDAAAYLEVAAIGREPGIEHLRDLDPSPAEREPERRLLAAMSGMALDPAADRGGVVHGGFEERFS
jgi:hypothetical protein